MEPCALPAKEKEKEKKERETFLKLYIEYQYQTEVFSRGEVNFEKTKSSTGVRRGKRIITIEKEVVNFCSVLSCFEFIIRFGTKNLSAESFSK